MTGYAALSAARLTEWGWAVVTIPVGDDWRVECTRGAEEIVIEIPGYGLAAAMLEAETHAKRISPPQR